WLVLLIYGALFVLVFIPDPAHRADGRAQLGALAALVGAALAVAGYVQWVVPRLRAGAGGGAGRAARRPRRPGG
ncbi:MAG: hypothetical protein JWN15_3667, partial [Firmicutes bacterium]|nr:hypothetical protein [Bacillota bacterium]